ncbi:Bacterial membrane flanked domain protein [Planctomycetes bacterium MalM25]|nr:Bacterial membrane flanked domain protein [Planctomycetes bacterium MalM25]
MSAENDPESPAPAAEASHPAPPRESPRDRFKQAAADRQGDDHEDEETLWTGSYSHLGMIGTWIGGAVATVAAIVIGLLISLSGTAWLWLIGAIGLMWLGLAALYGYRRLSVHYTLTTQRLLTEMGILWRTMDRVELIDVDDVIYRQGPVDRLLGVGTIVVTSSDRTTPELDLPGIENVREVADAIDDARRKERRSRGLHIEAV